jgi:hypothetical protein
MHVMVYGTYGRAGIYMIREYCRLLGVRATDQELRDLGALIGALSDNHPIAAVARQAKDFRQSDALADALLHRACRPICEPAISYADRWCQLIATWLRDQLNRVLAEEQAAMDKSRRNLLKLRKQHTQARGSW